MPSKGTPSAGLTLIAQRVFLGPAYTLVAYTNAQDTLGSGTLVSDLTQPTGGGYAPILLDGSYGFSGGVATYSHAGRPADDGFGNPCWIATGAWSATVFGVALIFGSTVQHYSDIVDSVGAPSSFIAAAGAKFSVDMQSLIGG